MFGRIFLFTASGGVRNSLKVLLVGSITSYTTYSQSYSYCGTVNNPSEPSNLCISKNNSGSKSSNMGANSSTSSDLVNRHPPIVAQNALLNKFCGDTCHIESKTLDLSNGHINYIEVVSKEKWERRPHRKNASGKVMEVENSSQITDFEENENVLVLTHGYGSGIGFFYPNFPELARIYDRVVAFDWLGMGGSSREPKAGPPLKGWLNCNTMTGTKASDFFIDHLEEFRSVLGLKNFVLAGHSLGGYLAGRYALKYPDHLRGLVLISPAGISPHPEKEYLIAPSELSLRLRTIHNAWTLNFTPQMYVRLLPEGKAQNTVQSVLKRRFGPDKFSEENLELLSSYLYSISAAPACGEYALNSILTPKISHKSLPPPPVPENHKSVFPPNAKTGVYAHEPLHDLFAEQLKVPSVYVMYGDNDWLAYDRIQDHMNYWKTRRADDGHDLHVHYSTIPGAGHHIYLDNPDHFHKEMEKYHNHVFGK